MEDEFIELKPTVTHINKRNDIGEHVDIMDLTDEDLREINKKMKKLYKNRDE